jgi:hypothetical protein
MNTIFFVTNKRLSAIFALYFLCVTLFALATPSIAEDYSVLTYKDPAGLYEFDYPSFYRENHEFADGTGDLDGIRSELVDSTESNIRIIILEIRGVKSLTAETAPTYVEQFKSDLAPDPKTKFISATQSTFLGQMAMDMKFEKKGFSTPYRTRLIATTIAGKDVIVQCGYTLKAEPFFGQACEYVAASLRLGK